MKEITVVSLGPGPRSYLTLGALETLEKAERLILRTELCDAAQYLREKGIIFETLDDLHESCEDFEELKEKAVKRLLKAAEKEPVCYAVLDASADETVDALREKAELRIVPGMPLSAPVLAAAPQDAVEIQTASRLHVTGTQNPLLLLECDSRMLVGECKLQLLDWYDPDQPVYFFPPMQGAQRRYTRIALAELDRQKAYDHTCAALLPAVGLAERKRFDFYDLVHVMAILRGEDGCPWDRAQTHDSLKKYLIEEAYETADAIREEDWDHVADELGDVLLQVVFQANIGQQYGTFGLADITTAICRKMMIRHPHIFSGAKDEDGPGNWDTLKMAERGQSNQSEVLAGVSRGLPALMRAEKVQKKARNVGFDWDDPRDALAKVHEEADEVLEAINAGEPDHLREELGDLFFACVNVCRLCGEDSENAMTQATEKFIKRFTMMENLILADGKSLKDLTLAEMDVYWNMSKARSGVVTTERT